MITDTGFFPDGRWHGMAKTLRTEGEGEQLLENVNRELLARRSAPDQPGAARRRDRRVLRRPSATPIARRSHLDLYRSGDFSKLEPYAGKLTALGVPA